MGPTFFEVELIGSGFLAVMAKPVSGEWIGEEFSGLHSAGIHQVVSLLEEREAFELGLADEKQLCEEHGLKFTSYPMKDRGLPPTVDSFTQLAMAIYHQTASGQNTVIHCRAGIGRTGLLAAGVLLRAGFEVDEAFARISDRRGVEVPDTEEQRDWLRKHYGEVTRLDEPRGWQL